MFGVMASIDDVEAGVSAETFGDDDALGCLVVFEQCRHDARQGERRAVEGVAEVDFFVGVAVAAFQAVGLVCFEVGYGGYFEPTFLGCAIYFEVECDCAGEGHVAAAEAQDVPGQSEAFEQALYVVFHLFEGCVRVFGAFDAYDFDFIELVETVEAADVFAVTAGFAAPACAVCAVFDGEAVGGYDDVAVEVGDGYFGGGDEVEAVEGSDVHLCFFVGELSGAVTGCFVDYVRRFDFEVSGFVGAVEEELYESALEASAFAEVYGESGAGDFDAEVEVYDVILFGEFPVGECVFGEVGHRSAGFFDDVVGCGSSFGYHVAGDVGDVEQDVADFFFGGGECFGGCLLVFFECSDFGFFCFGGLAVAGFHECADGVGVFFELSGGGVAFELEATAVGIEGEYAVDGFVAVESFDGKASDDVLRVLLDLL